MGCGCACEGLFTNWWGAEETLGIPMDNDLLDVCGLWWRGGVDKCGKLLSSVDGFGNLKCLSLQAWLLAC